MQKTVSATAMPRASHTYLDRLILHPGLLRRIRHTALPRQVDPCVRTERDVVHLTQERHQQGRLARTRGPDDKVELALLEDELVVDTQAECLPRGRDAAVSRLVRPGEVGATHADVFLVLSGAVDDGLGGLFGKDVEEFGLS